MLWRLTAAGWGRGESVPEADWDCWLPVWPLPVWRQLVPLAGLGEPGGEGQEQQLAAWGLERKQPLALQPVVLATCSPQQACWEQRAWRELQAGSVWPQRVLLAGLGEPEGEGREQQPAAWPLERERRLVSLPLVRREQLERPFSPRGWHCPPRWLWQQALPRHHLPPYRRDGSGFLPLRSR